MTVPLGTDSSGEAPKRPLGRFGQTMPAQAAAHRLPADHDHQQMPKQPRQTISQLIIPPLSPSPGRRESRPSPR